MATLKNEEAEQHGATARPGSPGHAEHPRPDSAHGSGMASGPTDHPPPRPTHSAAHLSANEGGSGPKPEPKASKSGTEKTTPNNVRKIRMERMMSKAELARRAGVSTLTIDRVENGLPCRMDTKRKILEALGLNPTDRVMVFGEDD